MELVRGSTSVMVRVFIQDNSVTTGAGLTGLTNASTNLNIATMRELDTAATVYSGANIEAQTTVGTYQAPSTSAKIRFKEVDATNFPGEYELQFHNSAAGAFGTGDTSRFMHIYIREVTTTALKIAPCDKEIILTATDKQDGVHGGMTALPNAAPNAAGGLLISTAGGLDMDDIGADVDATETRVTLALPNAAPQAAGGLITSTAGSLDMDDLAADVDTTEARVILALPNAAPEAAGGLHSPIIRTGTAQAGSSTSVTLDAGASANNNTYIGCLIVITAGAASPSFGVINSYNGTTKVAGISGAWNSWGVNPGGTSTFMILDSAYGRVWDEVLNGSTHNVVNSAGRMLRSVGAGQVTIRTGTAQAGSTANTIKLDSGASAVNGIYNGAVVFLTGGTGLGQTRRIIGYVGSTKVATVDSNWVTTPDGGTTFEIDAFANNQIVNEGVAQAGGASTITLAVGASTTDSIYVNSFVSILSGTGVGQTRVITGYVGGTLVATVDSAWSVQPDSTSGYVVIPNGAMAPPPVIVPTSAENASTLLATALNTSVTGDVVGGAMLAARAQGFGKWVLDKVAKTITLYAADGITVVRTFTIDDATTPTQRV